MRVKNVFFNSVKALIKIDSSAERACLLWNYDLWWRPFSTDTSCRFQRFQKVRSTCIFNVYNNCTKFVTGAAPRFPSEDKERLLSEILRSCQN
jgi:hypothetical protein